MITTADLTGYGAIIEAVERLLDALPVDAVLLRHDKEIVASNESAAGKGLVQGVKCHEGWLHIDRPCPWCHAKKALSSGKPLDHMVRAKADENGEMVVVEEGGIIMDAALTRSPPIFLSTSSESATWSRSCAGRHIERSSGSSQS